MFFNVRYIKLQVVNTVTNRQQKKVGWWDKGIYSAVYQYGSLFGEN